MGRFGIFLAAFLLVFSLGGCGRGENDGDPAPPVQNVRAGAGSAETFGTGRGREVSLGGSHGTFTLTVPEGWDCVGLPQREDEDPYGIRLRPDALSDGFISVFCEPWFGVCGTGLEERELELAGDAAVAGYYDGNENWDFILYKGKNEKIVALSQAFEWTDASREQVMAVLDSLRYEPEKLPGNDGMTVGGGTAFDVRISLRDVTGTGAELSLVRRSGDPERTIYYGEDYFLRVYNAETSAWERTGDNFPTFRAVAYPLPYDEFVDFCVDWSGVYGKLEPGTYCLGKSLSDGDHDPSGDEPASADLRVYFIVY